MATSITLSKEVIIAGAKKTVNATATVDDATARELIDKGFATYTTAPHTAKAIREIISYTTMSDFPTKGDAALYIAEDTNFIYRWSGSAYVKLTA